MRAVWLETGRERQRRLRKDSMANNMETALQPRTKTARELHDNDSAEKTRLESDVKIKRFLYCRPESGTHGTQETGLLVHVKPSSELP